MQSYNIGVDILKIERIEKIYSKFGQRFLDKIFNELEKEYIREKNYNIETIAGMFSFKETVAKCMGTGFGKNLKFKDITIFHDHLNKPYAIAKNRHILLSASHDGGLVITVGSLEKDFLEVPKLVRDIYIKRIDKSHKGTFGRTMVIASSNGMVGAGYLASCASLRAGCGYTYHYVFEEDNIFLPLSIKHTEVILKCGKFIEDSRKMDSILIGPGLGVSRNKREVLRQLLETKSNLVIDADGLNILAEDISLLLKKKANVVLTPHILEFSRLVKEIIPPGERLYKLAKEFARENKVVLVLKDSKTFVTDGFNSELVDKENSGLATAGSGDVLSGIITSLIAQGYDGFNGALLGVHIHSLAGELASRKKSKATMLASDIIDNMDCVFRILEEG